MSASNCFVGNDNIQVFSDTAVYDLENGGAIHGFGNKVVPLLHHRAVISCTGYAWVSIIVSGCISASGAETFDDLAARLPDIVKDMTTRDRDAKFGNFEVLLAGFSESTGEPAAYVLTGYPKNGWPAFTMKKVSSFISPFIERRQFDFDNPESSGLRILEEQRQALCGSTDKAGLALHAVGGCAQMTTVRKDGIEMKVIHRWPDTVGRPIEAAA
ncbi:hypothetical protein DUT91_24140 [Phyllobacterium salinisoli]|uniref:Uncharacterized protein n=1 Tax=Phyllobacterium salinisoli TaxID=1899321 RepID=A0A368JYA6_9HYPH|nr:hypothetical protein [Phyllobacterium salinisoli]RCS21435.1 hypothetical protein DUT91_24140 [Phyllobacterium salinisoli]